MSNISCNTPEVLKTATKRDISCQRPSTPVVSLVGIFYNVYRRRIYHNGQISRDGLIFFSPDILHISQVSVCMAIEYPCTYGGCANILPR